MLQHCSAGHVKGHNLTNDGFHSRQKLRCLSSEAMSASTTHETSDVARQLQVN